MTQQDNFYTVDIGLIVYFATMLLGGSLVSKSILNQRKSKKKCHWDSILVWKSFFYDYSYHSILSVYTVGGQGWDCTNCTCLMDVFLGKVHKKSQRLC